MKHYQGVIMLLLLLSLVAYGDTPAAESSTLTVVDDNLYENIYVEPPRMICSPECISKEWVQNAVFIQASKKHKSWFKSGKIGGIYNDETINMAFDTCDFKTTPFKCGKENGVWILRTTYVQTENKVAIQIMLFDNHGNIIGQGSQEEIGATTVIKRKKITRQQDSKQTGLIQTCPIDQPVCATIPVDQPGQSIYEIEDLEPSVVRHLPVLREKHVSQAMISVYDGIKK